MELRRSFDIRKFVVLSYFLLASIYLAIGFLPKSAEATNYSSTSAKLSIPSISLNSSVAAMTLHEGVLDTPDTIVGSFSRAKNKTFLVGHRAGVFENLNQIETGDEIIYNGASYTVTGAEVLAKAEISMNKLLAETEEPTLVVMTCAGDSLPGGDATHRLIITATR